MQKLKLAEYFEWDVSLWGQAMKYWHPLLEKSRGGKALDIGSRRGGLAKMLAIEYNYEVVATDIRFTEEMKAAVNLLDSSSARIKFEIMDCTSITFADNTFDIVIFKSVLGALGSLENQKKAFSEIHRVLKTGGALLYAENLRASIIHRFLRDKFRKHYALAWRYPTLGEFSDHLKNFSAASIYTAGFFTNFFKKEKYKRIVSVMDKAVIGLIPRTFRYIIYGSALK